MILRTRHKAIVSKLSSNGFYKEMGADDRRKRKNRKFESCKHFMSGNY